MRAAAAVSIRTLGKEATPLLLKALKDEDWRVAERAVESLGQVHQAAGPARFHTAMGATSRVCEGPEAELLKDFDRYYHFAKPP